MPPHDASNGNSDSWSRLRKYVEKTNAVDNRDRPGLASCKRPLNAPPAPVHDDEDDGPITTRWAAG
jgi:hypothetical protein